MRTAFVIALSLGIVIAGSAAARDGREASGKPRLQLVRGASLTLRGTHFVAGEHVTLRVSGVRNLSKRTQANDRGAFVVRFAMSFDRCNSSLTASAVGDRGSRARIKTPPVMCPPRL